MVQKSRTGKKKRNPYQGKAAQQAQAKKETADRAAQKKTSRMWMMIAVLYLLGVLFAGQFAPETFAYQAINIACNLGIVAAGAYMIISGKMAEKKGVEVPMMNTMFGFVLIVMGIMQAITYF